MRVINEPTSVYLDYKFVEGDKDYGERKCFVYDFGSGTYDATILINKQK